MILHKTQREAAIYKRNDTAKIKAEKTTSSDYAINAKVLEEIRPLLYGEHILSLCEYFYSSSGSIVPIRRQGFVLANANILIGLLAEIDAVVVGRVTLSSAPLPASFFSPKDNGYILAPIRKRVVLVFLVLVVSSMTRPILAVDSSPTQSATGTSC